MSTTGEIKVNVLKFISLILILWFDVISTPFIRYPLQVKLKVDLIFCIE